MHQRHKRRRVGRNRRRQALGQRINAAQQEHIRTGATVDVERVQSIVLGTAVEHIHDVVVCPSSQAAMREHGVGIGTTTAVHINAVAHRCAGGIIEPIAQRGQRGHVVNNQHIVTTGQTVGVTEHAHMAADGGGSQCDDIVLTLTGQFDLIGRQAAFGQQCGADGVQITGVAPAAVHRQVATRGDAASCQQVHVVTGLQQHVTATDHGQRVDGRTVFHHQVFVQVG